MTAHDAIDTAFRSPRRVVTGVGKDGRSMTISDGPAAAYDLPAFDCTDMWKTTEAPAKLEHAEDQISSEFTLGPSGGGTIFRYLEFPPDSSLADENGYTPYWHRTDTVDYIFIVKGEIWCLLENGEVQLKPGDVLVQRGTEHAWSVRGDQPCLMLAVLVDATGAP